jgi:hypothetical protein
MMSDQIIRSYQSLNVDVDMVLRGQGADPAIIRQRKPRLVALAERALAEGLQLIEPLAVYRVLPVEKISHERITLQGGLYLRGTLLAQHLGCAEEMALIVCTLGAKLENRVSALMTEDPAYAFALDGFGSVAAEALGLEICSELEANAQTSGLFTSIPLNPGMIGWTVGEGQPQIFSALDATRIGVRLNESAQMIPHKSVSMILGISHFSFNAGRPCDFCSMNETCRYQNRDTHYGGETTPTF